MPNIKLIISAIKWQTLNSAENIVFLFCGLKWNLKYEDYEDGSFFLMAHQPL